MPEIPIRRRTLEPEIPQDWPLLPFAEPATPGHGTHYCHGCDSGKMTPLLDLGRQPLAERDDDHTYPLGLVQCGNCGLVQVSWVVPRGEVFPADHPYRTGATKALREHFAGLAAEAAALLGDGDLIVDIGANDGTFLAAVRRLRPRSRILAIEPTGAVRDCRTAWIPAEQEFWSPDLAGRILKYLGQAKVITASNVLAHTDDPHAFLDGVKALLARDGTFITENHDYASVVNGLQLDTVYHEHVMFFTPATLGRLLEQNGFLAARTELVTTHGGSFRTFAVRRQPDLQDRANTARDQLRRLLEKAGEQGKIYGIGAATRAAPLIHFAGLERWLDRIAEVPGHPKIGRNFPGTAIPVVSETQLIVDQPPHALLLCWHVADTVVPALRAAGYEGRFIIPLPQARYVNG